MSKLVRLVYVSTSTNPMAPSSGNIPSEVGRILMQSRKNNPASEVGGVLYFSNNYFFQCLEGEQSDVDRVYRKISTDPRHQNLQTVSVRRVDERLFADWSMKHVALEQDVKAILQQYGLDSFNPYNFDEAIIDQILNLFVVARDSSAQSDEHNTSGRTTRPGGLLGRLFHRRRRAA